MSSVAPDRHLGVSDRSQRPKPTCCNCGRSTPKAWNGPVIQISTKRREVVATASVTATFELCPDSWPAGE